MKKLLVALCAALMLGGTALATQTTSWAGAWNTPFVVAFQTHRTGDITASSTYQIKNNTAITLTVRNEDYTVSCDVVKDHRRSGASGVGVITCSIVAAPAAFYTLTLTAALGGKNHGTLTVVAETDP